ncbi:MAG TPA: sigma-70 family RNA polymerase sigma factor [Bacteroidia bacterium]|nr:sigma-70 family RNA polymerase sigma factor [Bacteroidia bacterium]
MSVSKVQYSDEEFIEGLRRGDNDVLKALYKKYYQLVLKFIVNNNGTQEAAEDVYQECMIVLFENASDPGFSLHCQLQTYVYSVARRLWLKQLKKAGKTFLMKEDEEMDLADVSEDLQVYLQKESDLERLRLSMDQLGEPCGTLIRDFYVHKLSMDQISAKFGYTNADNAKNQKYKCLQRLKRYFFESRHIEQTSEKRL